MVKEKDIVIMNLPGGSGLDIWGDAVGEEGKERERRWGKIFYFVLRVV